MRARAGKEVRAARCCPYRKLNPTGAKPQTGTPMGAVRTGLREKLNQSPPCRNEFEIASRDLARQPNQRKCWRFAFTRK